MWRHCPSIQTPLVTAVSDWKDMHPSYTQITIDHLVGYSSLMNCLHMAKEELEQVREMKPHFKQVVHELGEKCEFLFSHEDEWVKEELIDEIRSLAPGGTLLSYSSLINSI